jgi:Region found in RelA / SpoT proteins
MIVPTAVQLRFTQTQPYLTSVRSIVDGTIRPWAEEHEYEYLSRPKLLASIAEKIETGRFARWGDLDDLVACTIVVPTHSHEPQVIEFLDAAFERVKLRSRGTAMKPPEVFRFDSTRWIGRLRSIPGGDRAPTTEQTLFEVQVASAFEHAWSVTTHDLVYKGDEIDWSRARLVAQVKASVEQIDMLIDGFERSTDLVAASPWKDLDQRVALRACFVQKLDSGQIPSELRPKDWVRFADNLHGLIHASTPDRNRKDEHFAVCLAALEGFTGDPPRSCSLFQTAMGVLAQAGLLAQIRDRYVPLVTIEAEAIFPSLASLPRRFEI